MPRKLTELEQTLKDLDEALTAKLKDLQPGVLAHASTLEGSQVTLPSLHGFIGGKNNEFVDSIREQFATPEDFLARWLQGLLKKAKAQQLRGHGGWGQSADAPSALRLVEFLQNSEALAYTKLFLERNFYRNLDARTRPKPGDSLWSLWFGTNQMTWGLLIAPAWRGGGWANDVSEIRRASYRYWTIGHVLATGIVDPSSQTPIRFASLGDFVAFYQSVLKRVSNSDYEAGICERYIAYLQSSPAALDEPLLIPELRYGGLATNHQYRLDFSVLNYDAMTFTGFELSPHSTHMAISGIRTKTQVQMNRELAAKWAGEMAKRRDYFNAFSIPIVTFTDDELADLDKCFAEIAKALGRRRAEPVALAAQELELRSFDFQR